MKFQIPSFESARVLVVGDVMLDRYWSGATSRISPEAPVPVVHVNHTEERPGGAGNVALNIAALGGKATVVGVIGDDYEGKTLVGALSSSGIQCLFDTPAAYSTTTKLRVLSRHQQLIRLDLEGRGGEIDNSSLISLYLEQLRANDVVVLSDYGKGALRPISGFISEARKAGKPVLVDPKHSDFGIYRRATLITPNLAEFEAVAGPCDSESKLINKGMNMIEALELEALLITRSEDGMTLLQKDQEPLHIPVQSKEVFDVTGAGDTVIAVLAAVLAAGQSLPAAVSLANLAAGIVVEKLGSATVTVDEMKHALATEHVIEEGVLSEEKLQTAVQLARARGEKIVMTNGCFDLLHEGHIAYLDKARQLGDRLIVAVNDDASVQRLKGEGRPINHLVCRMTILAALEYTDWVVPFTEDTPERLICAICPDVLVKGGDYVATDVAGYDCVTKNGGQVIILDFMDGCSTTNTIEKIRGKP